MTFGSRSGVTSESQAGSSGLQSAGFNMLGATPNPLKQRPLLLRLLCLPYPQEAGGTHKFARRGYVLMSGLRRLGLKATELAGAQVSTIRTKLLKIGAQIRVTVRKVWVSMASSYPWQDLYQQVWTNLRC